jgi:hypothetical protein
LPLLFRDLISVAIDPKMKQPDAGFECPRTRNRQSSSPCHAVIEEGRQYRPIADALEGIVGRGIERLAGVGIAKRLNFF